MLKSIRNWTAVDTIADIADAVADWASFLTDFFKDTTKGISSIANGFSEVTNTLTTKFPFSIPWDIAFLIAFLASTPAVPVFEMPLTFPNLGIDYVFVLDFTDFEIISKVCRLILTMVYTIGLLKFTEKVISNKKE
jgi:hypothetical protein